MRAKICVRHGIGRAVEHDLPRVQTEEPGGNRPALVEIMTVHEDGDTLGARYILQQRKDLPPGDRVERGERLSASSSAGLSA